MFDKARSLESFLKLLNNLSREDAEKVLEIYLRNGRRLTLKVEVTDNAIEPFYGQQEPPAESSRSIRGLRLLRQH
jgi:hypothetical protein